MQSQKWTSKLECYFQQLMRFRILLILSFRSSWLQYSFLALIEKSNSSTFNNKYNIEEGKKEEWQWQHEKQCQKRWKVLIIFVAFDVFFSAIFLSDNFLLDLPCSGSVFFSQKRKSNFLGKKLIVHTKSCNCIVSYLLP